jgi:hypothetical protein
MLIFNIKKNLFTAFTGDGSAASDEGAGGLPSSAVHEGAVLVAADE